MMTIAMAEAGIFLEVRFLLLLSFRPVRYCGVQVFKLSFTNPSTMAEKCGEALLDGNDKNEIMCICARMAPAAMHL